MSSASLPPPDRRLRRVIAAAWLLFWVLMVVTAVQDFLQDDEGPLWHPVLWETSSAFTATVLLLVQRRFSRKYDSLVAQPRAWFARQAPWLLLYWIAFVPLAFGIRHAVYALAGDVYPHESWPRVFIYENIKMTIFFAIFVVVTFGVLSWQAMQGERLRAERIATQLRTAQLQQLTQQMQPHFLFNALNTIAAVMHEDVERADALLVRLAELLRTSMAGGARQQVPLADELRLLRAYADLMAARFADRVDIAWHVAPDLGACMVPAMCLQPLLENVFRHTVEQRRDRVRIGIYGTRTDDRLVLAVTDDAGTLTTPSCPDNVANMDNAANAANSGIALNNLRARLEALYGAEAALTLTALVPAGVRAELTLPCRSVQ